MQYDGETTMHAAWFPAFADGVISAGGRIEPGDLACVCYGDVFRDET